MPPKKRAAKVKKSEEAPAEEEVEMAPEPVVNSSNDSDNVEKAAIPDGRPKSGRHWKVKQTVRTSMDKMKGVNARLRKSYEVHKQEREKRISMKLLEKEMKQEKADKKAAERARKEEREKRRKENEFKTSAFQQISGEKLKKMGKKALKNIAKTSMSKSGVLELVPAYKK